jgi:phage baseplate assembly protein W
MMVMRLKKLLKEVICEYEPRIELDNVEVNTSDAVDGRLYIKVNYTIVATGKEATWENTINLQM